MKIGHLREKDHDGGQCFGIGGLDGSPYNFSLHEIDIYIFI